MLLLLLMALYYGDQSSVLGRYWTVVISLSVMHEWYTWSSFTSTILLFVSRDTVQPAWGRSRRTLLGKTGVKGVCRRQRDCVWYFSFIKEQHPLLVLEQHSYQTAIALNQWLNFPSSPLNIFFHHPYHSIDIRNSGLIMCYILLRC